MLRDFAADGAELGGDADIGQASSTDGEFLCVDCGHEARTLARLKLHRLRVHGVRRAARQFVVDSVCPACGGDFRSRLRVLKHLERGASACQAALASGRLPVFSAEAIAAADATDALARRAAKDRGVWPESGPPARRAARPAAR